jgi:phosphoribosylaminoimidazolecarboxamide formyltransferase/IMP cyclohydrolase
MSNTGISRTALMSVADKTGVETFAGHLREMGVRIVSSGGTSKYLKDKGIDNIDIESLTGLPQMFDGRVKTLHPVVFGGILADREKESHLKTAAEHNIDMIDIVVVNLYPFESTVSGSDIDEKTAIENIDIGGVALIRAAAKNFRSVYIITDPSDYGKVIESLKNPGDNDSIELRRYLAEKAFRHTAYYDSLIGAYFRSGMKSDSAFPGETVFGFRKISDLRYGENPHQKAALYRNSLHRGVSLANSTLHSGKELSFNNIYDLEAVLTMLLDFPDPFAVIVKHTNPCGAACGGSIAEAYADALACDEMSAFGGIAGVNRVVDRQTAESIHNTFFLECVIAPGYEDNVLDLLKKKKNRRILSCGELKSYENEIGREARMIMGGMLMQSRDRFGEPGPNMNVVTNVRPTARQTESLSFAMRICRHIKSNAIVIVDGRKTVGIGAGQVSRVDSSIIAVRKAGDRADGAVAASDAFFPMPDGLETLARAGVRAVIQPGGSKKDPEVIAAADNMGIAMVFTGERHFKH